MKKLVLLILPMLFVAACNPTTSEPTTSIEEPTTVTIEEPVVEKKVEFAPMHLYQDLPTLEIRPLFSVESMKDEEHFTYTVDDERIATVDGNVVTYVAAGRTLVKAVSENFSTQFVLFTHEGFSTVGGPLATEYAKLKERYEAHEQKDNSTIFIGDSFFQFWRDGTAGASFRTDFKEKNAVNLGINGTTTHHWRAIMRHYLVDTLVNPKNFIINIGINNVDDNSEDGPNAGKNVRMLLEDIHEAFPEAKVYYFSITRCSSGVFATYWDRHDGANTYLKNNYFPNATYATYLDANEVFGDDYADFRMSDGLHLNGRGYLVFKRLINENVEIESLDE